MSEGLDGGTRKEDREAKPGAGQESCAAGDMPELNVLCPTGDDSARSDQPLMKHLVVEVTASGLMNTSVPTRDNSA